MSANKKQVRFETDADEPVEDPAFPRPMFDRDPPVSDKPFNNKINFFERYDEFLRQRQNVTNGSSRSSSAPPTPCSQLELSIVDSDNVFVSEDSSCGRHKGPLSDVTGARQNVLSGLREDAIKSAHNSTKEFNQKAPENFNFFTLPDSNLAMYNGKPILDMNTKSLPESRRNYKENRIPQQKTVKHKKERRSSCCDSSEEEEETCCRRNSCCKSPEKVRKQCRKSCHCEEIQHRKARTCCDQQDKTISNGLEEKKQVMEKISSESQPSVAELHEIIKMQNQQLNLLQQKLDKLLSEQNDSIRQVVKEITETQQPPAVMNNQKISIGVMTSFEFTVQNNDSENILEGIEKIDLTTSPPKNTTDTSVSPMPSRVLTKNNNRNNAINMEDYSDSEDECSRPNAGWTFYNNIMHRVNHILSTPPPQQSRSPPVPEGRLMMREFVSSQRVTMDTTPQFPKPMSETSIHMMKLAGKYLNPGHSTTPRRAYHPAPAAVYNEMSFATMQYMQRYHLSGPDCFVNNEPRTFQNRNFEFPQQKGPSKILDITAIRQQPKLL